MPGHILLAQDRSVEKRTQLIIGYIAQAVGMDTLLLMT